MEANNFIEKWLSNAEKLNDFCHIDNDSIKLKKNSNGYSYDIELGRCDTPIKILEWAVHLSEKNWTTKEVIKNFIVLASDYHKINIFTGA